MTIRKVKVFAEVIAGQSPESKYYSESKGVPFLQGNRTFGQVHPTIDTYTTKVTKMALNGDILMSVRAPVGDLNLADRDICIGRGLAAIRPKNIDGKFLFFALNFGIENLLQKGNGTTFDAVDKTQIEELELLLPKDEDSWEKIGDFLWKIETQIFNYKDLIEKHLAFCQILFSKWFIQFDFPTSNQSFYRSSGGKFTKSSKFSSVYPEVWAIEKLNEYIKIGSGFPFNSDMYEDNGKYSVITIKNVQDGFIDLESQNRITIDSSALPKHCILKRGDLLVSLTGNVGRVALVNSEGHLLNQRVGVISSDSIWRNFAYLYLLLPEVKERLINIANGSSQDNLSPLDIFNDYFPVPPREVLSNFNELVSPIIESITKLYLEISKLKKLQAWFIPHFMNDNITFK